MSTLRRKYKSETERRLERARTELANRFGNLNGLRLKQWFQFNGQTAVIVGDTARERRENFDRFTLRLKSIWEARGTAAIHRARREGR